MKFNANNEELIKKVHEWNENPELMASEFETFMKEKIENSEGLEWYDLLIKLKGNSQTEESAVDIYSVLLQLLSKSDEVRYFLEKYFSLFNEMSDTAFEPLTVATIIRDSIVVPEKPDEEASNEDKLKYEVAHQLYTHWTSVVSGLYNEMKMEYKAFEEIAPLIDSMSDIGKAQTLLFSNIPENIEKGKELVKLIDCDELYEKKDPSVIGAGSLKFYSGINYDGLIHHFGAEDFRPHEFIHLRTIPNHTKANFNGKSVVVTPYRGMGDSMILSRFIPKFLEKYPGVKLSIATEKPLIPLYEGIKGIHHVGDIESCAGMIFDYCLGVNHLARYLRESLVDDRGHTPAYDWVSYSDSYDKKWEYLKDNKPIGINWKSSQRLGGTGGGVRSNQQYKGRDIDLREFIVIVKSFPNKKFIVLNPDVTDEEKSLLTTLDNVILPKIKNFGDTAAIINACECIVSVDTSISTLSASMHKRTIVMAKFWCDYRWMYNDLWWKEGVSTVFRKDELNASWVIPIFNTIETLKKEISNG